MRPQHAGKPDPADKHDILGCRMSSPLLETFLARLYTDQDLLHAFLSDPVTVAQRAGLSEQEITALREIDRTGLMMAAESYSHKRKRHQQKRGLMQRWLVNISRFAGRKS
jgi:hypothetical protein